MRGSGSERTEALIPPILSGDGIEGPEGFPCFKRGEGVVGENRIADQYGVSRRSRSGFASPDKTCLEGPAP